MSTLGSSVLTMIDWAKRLDPNGSIAKIIELLAQKNPILDDMQWMEGNLPTGHRTTIRTGLPEPTWRMLNQGVQPTKSITAQITEAIGMVEDFSQIDKDLAELNADLNAFLLSESKPHIEGINQEVASTLFYGNSNISPNEITGLSARYSSLSAANARNIVNGGGSGSDNSSIWLIVWGDSTVHGIFPKGSQAGILHENLGIETVENAGGVTGALMRAYRNRWQWKCGLVLKDWRYAVRIANIDISNLVAGASAADLITLMKEAYHRVEDLVSGTPCFYMNRTLYKYLDIQARNDVISGGGLTSENIAGKPVRMFNEIPVKRVDALLETEDAVS